MQVAHLQQRAYKGAQALELFLLKAQQRGCFGIHLRMLRRKKLEPCLYERQRRAKLVRRIAGELPLRVKRLRQTVEHGVDRPAQLPELGGRVLGQAGVGQAFLVDLPGLPRKIAQWLERPSADEIRDDGAQQCHQRGDAPAHALETHLFCTHLLRKAAEERLHILLGYLNGHFLLVSRFVLHHKAVQRIHAVRAGVKQQQIQAHARRRDEQRSQYRNAPLDRNSFAHSPAPIS